VPTVGRRGNAGFTPLSQRRDWYGTYVPRGHPFTTPAMRAPEWSFQLAATNCRSASLKQISNPMLAHYGGSWLPRSQRTCASSGTLLSFAVRFLSPNCVQIPLRSRWHLALFLTLSVLVAMAGGAEALKIAAVAAFGESTDVSRVRRGLALDPNNAELHHRLSQLYGDSLALSNLTERVAEARRATALSPNKSNYWLNLASACESIRDDSCAEQSLRRALVLCPMVPVTWWVAGDHYLRNNQQEAAFSCFHHLVELSPNYLLAALSLVFRVSGDPETVFEKVVGGGGNAGLALAYVDYMSANNEFEAAHQAWRQVATSRSVVEFDSLRPYLEQLLSHGRFQEAYAIWLDLEQRGTLAKPPDAGRENLVFNGGFEQFPLNAGFDWRWPNQLAYLAIDFSAPGGYQGLHSLRIDFTASRNEEYEPVYQIVAVLPKHAYRLEACVRSEDITSDTGPSLRVSDTQKPGFRDAVSETTVGTTPWHRVQVCFSTGEETHAVRISVWRPRGRVFPTEISGSFWLDEVSLRSVAGT